jgi:hypothetical protein
MEPVPMKLRHVTIELWLSADMKFLQMVLGLKQSTARRCCVYCTADLHERHDWLNSGGEPRSSDDPIDTKGTDTGQAYKNLFRFIPRARVMIDTLHLLLRCVDRLVHLAAILCINLLGSDLDNDKKKTALLNETLAPVLGKVMRRNRVQFTAPEGSKTLWSLSRVNGTGYRRLLHKKDGFKFKDVLGEVEVDYVQGYQTAWDGFEEIFSKINSRNPPKTVRVQNLIDTWFHDNVNDYLNSEESLVQPDDKTKPKRLGKNNPRWLASFLLTPYYHALNCHVAGLLKPGQDLRTFSGQNFEKSTTCATTVGKSPARERELRSSASCRGIFAST